MLVYFTASLSRADYVEIWESMVYLTISKYLAPYLIIPNKWPTKGSVGCRYGGSLSSSFLSHRYPSHDSSHVSNRPMLMVISRGFKEPKGCEIRYIIDRLTMSNDDYELLPEDV